MVDAPVGDYDAHVRLWTGMLRTLIGWSKTQVARWAVQFKEDMADENSVFYCQPSEYYVACVLTPNRLGHKLGAARFSLLEADIQGVLQDVLESEKTIEGIDWQPAKEKINAILLEYGESLANIAQEHADRYLD